MNSSKTFTVAYITTGLSTGGAEIMLYRLLSRMNRERFTPAVISLMDSGTFGLHIENLGIPVYTLGLKPGEIPTLSIIWRLIKTVHHLTPDLIQGWMYHANLAACLAGIFYSQNVPVFWEIQHSITGLSCEKRMTQSIIRLGVWLSKSVNRVVFASQNSKAQHEALGYCSKNTCVIPNGFDTSLFQPSVEARLALRSELGLADDSFLIGLICRYHPMKDHANFLNAAALLSKKFPQVRFILAGTNVDCNNQTLVQLIEDLGIVNQTHLLGERSDMPRIIAALDILTVASAYGEAFPLVVGEAMSCGVPCVVTDVGDSAWIVGNTGRVVPARNSEALTNGWKELIELGTEGREVLGRAARTRIIQSFSLDSVMAQYEEVYESVLSQKLNTKPAFP